MGEAENRSFLTVLGLTRTYRSGIFWSGGAKCRDPSVGVLVLRPSTPLPQDDIWGWEDPTATQDGSRGRAGTPSSIFWG
jgi:hypothetical protein